MQTSELADRILVEQSDLIDAIFKIDVRLASSIALDIQHGREPTIGAIPNLEKEAKEWKRIKQLQPEVYDVTKKEAEECFQLLKLMHKLHRQLMSY